MRKHRLAIVAASAALWAAACSGWSPSRPFEREAPPVKEAVKKFFQEGQWYSATQSAAIVAQNREALKALDKS